MVWPILIVIAVIVIIGLFLYKKDQGRRGFEMNRYCLECKKRYPDSLSNCPYCGAIYFS